MSSKNDTSILLVSVFVFLCFFVYIQHSSQIVEELKVEKLYREQCKSDSILSLRIDSVSARLHKLEVIHAHKLKK